MKLQNKKNSGSGHFQIREGSKVIIHGKGSYRQVDLYKRGKNLFAENSKGKFVKLANDGATSVPEILWDEIIHDFVVEESPFGLLEGKKIK